MFRLSFSKKKTPKPKQGKGRRCGWTTHSAMRRDHQSINNQFFFRFVLQKLLIGQPLKRHPVRTATLMQCCEREHLSYRKCCKKKSINQYQSRETHTVLIHHFLPCNNDIQNDDIENIIFPSGISVNGYYCPFVHEFFILWQQYAIG